MSGPNLFAQIRKVDEEKRLVYGRAAEEAVDKSDEIMDYMSSKPHFQKWSADVAADSGGKNLGNVRAMHGKVAAGALTQIDFNDGEKAIDVCAKVVDDNEWKKVLAGVYTGFSIGGSYVGESKVEKMDGRDVKRYTARPSEISLVDRPCMPGAKFFEVQKADGTSTQVAFVEEPVAEAMEITGSAEEVAELGKIMNSNGLSMGDLLKAMPAFLKDKGKKKGGKDDKAEADSADDDSAGADAADAEKLAKVAADAAAAGVAADAARDVALTKLEASIKETNAALAKLGARNSKADMARLTSIHDACIALGAVCPEPIAADPDDDAGAAAKLAKAEADKLAKAAADAAPIEKLLAEKLAPMQKLLDEQKAKIEKLEAQPAAPTVRLRVLSKGDEMTDEPAKTPALVKDSTGEERPVASLIKSLHASGGAPLHLPQHLRG